MTSLCIGCFPRNQENQLAHMENGCCLWCDYEEENNKIEMDCTIADIFGDTDSSSEGSVKENETECCICYEVINKAKNNCVTECGHAFCLKCLIKSFSA